ncbi:putative ribosomal protein L7/L12 [Helianthus anomalus]
MISYLNNNTQICFRHQASDIIYPWILVTTGLTLTRIFSQPAKQVEEENEIEIDQKRLPTDYDPATFDPTEHCIPPTERVWRLEDEMSSLTLVEVAKLSSLMMKRMGMKEPPVVAVMKPGAAGVSGVAAKGQTAAKEETNPEKSIFELKLDSFEATSKIKIIKEVRTITVSCNTPKFIKLKIRIIKY